MANKFGLAGTDSKYKLPDAEPAGFWVGYWHGMIAPIAFVVSLFNAGVGIYETHNKGKWYDFGFVLGTSSTIRNGAKASTNAKDKKKEAQPSESEEAATDE